jgi:hypothetical protein
VVGKYIDMKLNTVQAARYATWEYTAHYVDLSDQPGGFTALRRSQQPVKSLSRVQNEAMRRFYSDTAIPINTNRDRGGYRASERNALWTYHNGLPMYQPTQKAAIRASGSRPTPDDTRLYHTLVGVVGTGMNYVAEFFDLLGVDAGFDAINPDGTLTVDGRYSAILRVPVEDTPSYAAFSPDNRKSLFLRDLNLKMKAKSGLMTETWGAGGPEHAVYQSSGLVPTVLIDTLLNGWGIPIQTIASTVLLSPELDDDNLQFGYPVHDPVVMDQVPVGALKNDTRTLDCPGGYCEQ